MEWLPAIDEPHSGWLLPLSCETSEFLAALICDASEGTGTLADPEWAAASMAARLRSDPALHLFSVLELLARRPEAANQQIELSEHAGWFCTRVPALFREHGRALRTSLRLRKLGSLDELSLSVEPGPNWRSLAKKTLKLPLEERATLAERWLVGDGDPLGKRGWDAWPRLIDDCNDDCIEDPVFDSDSETDGSQAVAAKPDRYGTASIDLFRLARAQYELRLLRERFASKLQAEKMASLGELAYGLSHEINNPLAAIRSRAEQLAVDERDPSRRERLSKIVGSAMRAFEMIADMMFFARPPRPEFAELDALELSQQVLAEFESSARERAIELRLTTRPATLTATACLIEADGNQVGDALRAVVRNAMEAVGDHGVISVLVRVTGEGATRRLIWTVTDTGPGLSAEARRHAFDPYFSGREAGRGLGLGLCRVYRVARAHGGGARIDGTEIGCRVRVWVRTRH